MKGGIYLTFDGNCKEAMHFYKNVFGKELTAEITFGESPMKGDGPLNDLMMHCSLNINHSFQLMACDRHPAFHKGQEHNVGNSTEIALMPESKAEADRLFAALSTGGEATKPLKAEFWGSYFGTCKDKYGINWMFDTALPSEDAKQELKRAAEALRDAAEQANAEAEKLEKMAAEPHAKKAKTEDKGLEAA